ncbi:MAG: PAS domain S-box protein [Peptococcaceae bacterium]|nr:PAS domain S-box protein [Peptococcaceae bacterium]
MTAVNFEKIFYYSPIPAFILQDGFFRWVNLKMARITGYAEEELLRIPAEEIVHPDDRSIFTDTALSLPAGEGAPGDCLFRAVNRNKEVMCLHGFFSFIEFNGRPAVLGQLTDMTGQDTAAEALQKSEAKYREIVNNANDIIYIHDLKGNILWGNPMAAKTFGYTHKEFPGLNVRDIIDAETIARAEDYIRKRTREGKSEVGPYELLIYKKDGSPAWIEVSTRPLREKGKSVAILGIGRDITDRKRAEEALYREKERLAVTLASIGEAVIAVDTDGLITLINPVAESLTGWGADEAIGRPLTEVFRIINEYTREPVKNPVQKVLEEGKTVGLANHTVLISRDGTERSVDDSAAPIRDVKGEVIGVILVFRDVTVERRKEEELKESEHKYRTIFESTGTAMVIIEEDTTISLVNTECENLTGYAKEEVEGKKSWTEFVYKDDLERMINNHYQRRRDNTALRESYEFRLIDRWGRIKNILLTVSMIPGTGRSVASLLDITIRKRMEEEINIQKAYFQQLFENSPEAIAMLDNEDRIINVNKGFEMLFQYSAEELKGRKPNEVIVPESFLDEATAFSKSVLCGESIQKESVRMKKDGSLVNVSIVAYPIKYSDRQLGICAIYGDITYRKQAEEKLKYLSLHDSLTGLYNRAYFEQEMHRLEGERHAPVGIIMCDVDGLKLVNDTLGHHVGDTLLVAAANVIREPFRKGDMVARIGGDEFAVLLPNSPREVVENACRRIREAVDRYNEDNPKLPLSISIGYAIGDQIFEPANIFKEADNNMYREKLHRSQSARSAIVQILKKALEARDFITEGHADRLQDLVAALARAVGLSEGKVTDLRLLAQFHDIGKVGITDHILFKPSPLSADEAAEMRRHCNIGHRIAQSASDLAPIADWILKHHEWWNGKGYPLGLKGEDIPLECRILAIADAYDAMTSDRPYHRALSHEEAVSELKRSAGTQFDPSLVPIFLQIIEEYKNKVDNPGMHTGKV